jgi:mono/diheme cytochrome c family protein
VKRLALAVVFASMIRAQNVQEAIKHGEEIYTNSCAGYCHGLKGGLGGGAPRLAGRGFEESFISNTIARGISGTAMPAFGATMDRPDLLAVTAYIASLNGIANPSMGARAGGAVARLPRLPADAARGRALFFDALRSFGRCSTCHDSGGMGVPVAGPIVEVPHNALALKALATPVVHTATVGGERMPALVVSEGKQRVLFYDLTSAPPVQRSVDPGEVKLENSSAWKHNAYISSYTDEELDLILNYLRAISTK